ncbi:MAG: polysulfide reductase NrfD [Chloroflexi bacterium]|nr:polysulfide reductase NrfD [Chloroflexota bacterium]
MLDRPFDTIAQDLRSTFRPQREWVQRKGLLLLGAFFFSGIGAGGWLFSLYLDWNQGLLWSLGVVVVASGVAHLAFLGRPERFWRALSRPQTSWISRGIWGIGFFGLSAVLYLLMGADPWAEASILGRLWLVLSVAGAVWLLVYKGFVFAYCKGIPFWNTAVVPALFFATGLRGGASLVLLLAVAGPSGLELHPLEVAKLWLALSFGALLVFYLWATRESGVAARRSVQDLVRGRVSVAFYAGVIAVGLVLPLAWSAVGLYRAQPDSVWIVVALSSLVGDLYVTYAVAKAGICRPLAGDFRVPARTPAR